MNLPTFNPENALLRECPFFVITNFVKLDDATGFRLTALASSAQDLAAALSSTLFKSTERTEEELRVLDSIFSAIAPANVWGANTFTAAPIDSQIVFEDSGYRIEINLIALCAPKGTAMQQEKAA